eukprot:jgi/Botrbrau1/19882/Bobra.0059s0003.1
MEQPAAGPGREVEGKRRRNALACQSSAGAHLRESFGALVQPTIENIENRGEGECLRPWRGSPLPTDEAATPSGPLGALPSGPPGALLASKGLDLTGRRPSADSSGLLFGLGSSTTAFTRVDSNRLPGGTGASEQGRTDFDTSSHGQSHGGVDRSRRTSDDVLMSIRSLESTGPSQPLRARYDVGLGQEAPTEPQALDGRGSRVIAPTSAVPRSVAPHAGMAQLWVGGALTPAHPTDSAAWGDPRTPGFPHQVPASTQRMADSLDGIQDTAMNYRTDYEGDDNDFSEGGPEEGQKGTRERHVKRLAQNREAARKSRQRRKQYVIKLEDEVKRLRSVIQRQTLAAGTGPVVPPPNVRFGAVDVVGAPVTGPPPHALGPSTMGQTPPWLLPPTPVPESPSHTPQDVDVLKSLCKWRDDHVKTAMAVKRLLDEIEATPELARGWEPRLQPLVEEARAQVWTLHAMKRVIIYSESVTLILNLEHMLPAERMGAWLGTWKPSIACQGVISKLDRNLDNAKRRSLSELKEDLAVQEKVLQGGFDQMMPDVVVKAGTARLNLSEDQKCSKEWDSQAHEAVLKGIKTVLHSADNLWDYFFKKTEPMLAMHEYAVVVTSMYDFFTQLTNASEAWKTRPSSAMQGKKGDP